MAWALRAGVAAAAGAVAGDGCGAGGGGGGGGGGDGGFGDGGRLGWLMGSDGGCGGGGAVKRSRGLGVRGVGGRTPSRRSVSRLGVAAVGVGMLGGVVLLASAPAGFRLRDAPAAAHDSPAAAAGAAAAVGRRAAVWGTLAVAQRGAPATLSSSSGGSRGARAVVAVRANTAAATADAPGATVAADALPFAAAGAAAAAPAAATPAATGSHPDGTRTAGGGGGGGGTVPPHAPAADVFAAAAPLAATAVSGSGGGPPGGVTTASATTAATSTASAAAALAAANSDADAPAVAVAAALAAAAVDADAGSVPSDGSDGAAAAAAAAVAAGAPGAPRHAPADATVHCYDRADVATMTEALCVYAPYSAAAVASVVRAHGGSGSGRGAAAPAVGCSAWDGAALPVDKANCSRVVTAAAASAWWTAAAAIEETGSGPSGGGGGGGGTGPPSVLLRLAARDVNIAHAGMKLLALHHVLRRPSRYGLSPSPAVVVHLADPYIAPVLHNESSWQAGLLAAVLAASPVGRVTITESLASTPAVYAVAAVVGGWSNRFSVGDSHVPLDAPVNVMAREDHAALRAALPLPSHPPRRGRRGNGGGGGDGNTPPPLRIVYLSRRHNHRRRFDPTSEARFIRTLRSAAADVGDAVVQVVTTGSDTRFVDQVVAVADAAVVIGLHGASLTTVLVGAWRGTPGESGGTLIEVRPYGFRLRLFDGAAVVGAYVPVELKGHGPEYGGRRRRPSADGAGWRESALACSWRDFRCFEYYRDATQVFGGGGAGGGGGEEDVATVRAVVTAALKRARDARQGAATTPVTRAGEGGVTKGRAVPHPHATTGGAAQRWGERQHHRRYRRWGGRGRGAAARKPPATAAVARRGVVRGAAR